MTNSYDVDHGLSQCPPGPLEPVELPQQDDTLVRTGNTARDQEMYAAGLEKGEENAKHNAAIRGGLPDGWKLVPVEPTIDMVADADEAGNVLGPRARRIYAAMLAAAPASPVSTVEKGDALALLDHPLLRDVLGYIEDAGPADVWSAAQAWMALRDAALSAAPAAGDARDADRDAAFESVRKRLCALPRYSFLSDGYGAVRRVEDRSGKWIEFDAAHELFDPVCVDAAIAAQRQGDA